MSQTDPLARLWYAETMLDEQVTDTTFEAHRGRLFGLAYRMLGSRAEAEDVVQDAFLRWHQAEDGRAHV